MFLPNSWNNGEDNENTILSLAAEGIERISKVVFEHMFS